MQRHHPAPYERIPVTMEVYNKISLAIFWDNRPDVTHWEIVAEAVDEWLRHHSPDAITLPAHLGYQWKQLFLPNGTLLRTVFNGKNYHCRVDNDQILYEGKPVSPSGFVNSVGGMRRNAWKSLWILRPDCADWQRADSLRPRQRTARRHKPPPAAQAIPFQSQLPPDTPRGRQQPGQVAAPENEAQAAPVERHARRTGSKPSHCSQPAHDGQQPLHPTPSIVPERTPGLSGGWRRKPRQRTPHPTGDGLAALLRQELLPFVRQLLGLPATGSSGMPPAIRQGEHVQNL